MEDFKMFLSKIKYLSNLTDKELAERIGISRSQLYRIKTGKSFPSSKFLTKLKEAFPEIDLNQIIKEVEQLRREDTKEKHKKEA